MNEILKNNTHILDDKYAGFLSEIKEQITNAKLRVVKTTTREQIKLYFWLGKHIVETQLKYGWGKFIVENLSKDLRKAFDSKFGFSAQNLWYMRQFYLEYKDSSKLQQLVGEIPWGQNLLILSKVKDFKAREYYLEAVKQMGWTRNILALQISSQAYERHLLSNKQNNFERALPDHLAEQADQAMKDVYILDMLGIAKPILELELEKKMVEKIKDVMLELGYGFSFIGNQYRISVEGKDYFIDILFFNRKLNSLVAIELKRGKFLPEYAGKMNFYLNLLDDFVKEPNENPSIGIILCSEKDRFEVEYSLKGIDKPVGVSEYKLTRNLPNELINKLPNPELLEKELLREMNIILEQEEMQSQQIKECNSKQEIHL